LNTDTDTDPVKILLVEDNMIDARLTCNALGRIPDWPSVIQVLDDGEKAVEFFRRQPSPLPDLVILDMNLPKYDGAEVLKAIRSGSGMQDLLVFIFSSSPVDVSEERIRQASIQADSYFEKPNEVGSFHSIATQMRDTYRSAGNARRRASA
jgi:CheY-like chemotaxis protein